MSKFQEDVSCLMKVSELMTLVLEELRGTEFDNENLQIRPNSPDLVNTLCSLPEDGVRALEFGMNQLFNLQDYVVSIQFDATDYRYPVILLSIYDFPGGDDDIEPRVDPENLETKPMVMAKASSG